MEARRGRSAVIFSFADFEVDEDCREVRRSGEPVHVEPQVFDLLVYLIRHRERVMAKAELLDAVWAGRIVSEATLGSRINAARRTIGDTGEDQKAIRTVPRRGFRFVADVAERPVQTLHPYPGSRAPQGRGYPGPRLISLPPPPMPGSRL